jgi:hypothetical protein
MLPVMQLAANRNLMLFKLRGQKIFGNFKHRLNILSDKTGFEKRLQIKLLVRKNVVNEYKMLYKVPSKNGEVYTTW